VAIDLTVNEAIPAYAGMTGKINNITASLEPHL
jgi:hypothetical protein